MVLLIILIIILIFFVHNGGVDQAVNIQKELIMLPDVTKIDSVEYIDSLGRIVKHPTRLKFYKNWESDQQISQILKHGSQRDKTSLILLFANLLPNVPEKKIIQELFATKSDKIFYEKFLKKNYKKPKETTVNDALIAYNHIKFLKYHQAKNYLKSAAEMEI